MASNHTRAAKGSSDFALVFLLLFLVYVWAGVLVGVNVGSDFGMLGKWVGGILGSIAGVIAAVLTLFVAALIDETFSSLAFWWRPYPPVCENGTCKGWRDYKSCNFPEDLRQRVKGMSSLGWRCKCGNAYAGGIGYGLQNRWFRVLPNGEIIPYLKHRPFGRRWIRDDGVGMGVPGRIEKAQKALEALDHISIPGWVIPCLTATICGGLAFIVVWQHSGFSNPIGPWFVMACATLGLILGCVGWWLGPKRI